jgi:outer membrane receptor protein involved in Fe transport
MSRKRNSRATGAARRSGTKGAGPRRVLTPQRKLLASAVAGCLMLGSPAAFSQSAASNLRGQVRTETGPAANTEVVATNVATGVTRRTRTSADGRYVLIGLDPGTWAVQAGGTTEVVTLSVASNSTLDIEAGEGTTAPADLDTITVVGTAAELDVLTSEVGSTVSPRLIEQLPQATRNFLEFADTVPGMAFTMDGQGFTSLRGGALSDNTGNLYIDGVGQKSYVAAGGIAGQENTRGNPFPQLAIDQYKVITSNYKAEYGQVAGAALTAVTRSGTNEFEAEAYYRFTNESLRETRPDEELPDADKVDSQTEEYGFAIGGPIIEDRLHYFLAYEYKDLITPRSVTPDPLASQFVQFLPADVQSQFGAQDVPFEEDLIFGKLSWSVTDNDLLELSLQYRDEVQVDSIGDRRSAEHGRDVINKDERATLRWERSADTWFNELLFGVEDSENNPFPTGIGPGFIYRVLERNNPDGSVSAERTLIETGPSSGFDAKAQKQKGWLLADNLTFTGFAEHTVKLGVSYRDLDLTFQDAGAINPQWSFEVDNTGVLSQPYRVDFLSRFLTSQNPVVDSDTKQYGFFIQDDWQVNEHLILNLGIRWDYEKNPAYTDFVTSQDFVNDLFADDPDLPGVQPWADRLLPSGINANDYISTGDNRDDYSDAWAPRFGFSYDINGDERHVIHGGAGRSYDRNLFSILSLEVTKAALSPVAIYFQDPVTGECYRDDGRPCIPWDPALLEGGIPALSQIPVTQGSAELFMLNNNLKTPYADQFSLGIANEIGEWRTDITVQRILAYDGFIFTLINRYPDGSFFQNGSQPWGEPVPGWANTILGSNGVESRNTQVLLSANKPYDSDSGWGVSLAYTYTNAKHNRQVGDNFAFDKPTIDQYPFIQANDVPEHRFVAAGTIDGPWDTIFGAKIVLETPRPINSILNYGFQAPDGSVAQPVAWTPPGTGSFLIGGDIWGYRTVDLQATKIFRIGDTELSARVNLLNVFDYENLKSFNLLNPGSGGVFDPQIEVNEFGDMLYVPRTLSFEVGFRF